MSEPVPAAAALATMSTECAARSSDPADRRSRQINLGGLMQAVLVAAVIMAALLPLVRGAGTGLIELLLVTPLLGLGLRLCGRDSALLRRSATGLAVLPLLVILSLELFGPPFGQRSRAGQQAALVLPFAFALMYLGHRSAPRVRNWLNRPRSASAPGEFAYDPAASAGSLPRLPLNRTAE